MTNINLNTMPATAANNSLKTKTKRAFAMLFLLGLMTVPKAFAQTQVGETIVDGVRYVLFDDGTASIENADQNSSNNFIGIHGNINGTLTLHETVTYEGNDYTLTRIEQYAFYNCENLTGQLVLPATLTSIGGMAFYGCRYLSGTLTLPPLLTEIALYTFYATKFTGDLVIPNNVTTIGKYAFNTNLFSSIDVGDGVTTIAERAFNGTEADQVILGCNVATVGDYAFRYGGNSSDSHSISIECRSATPAQLGTKVFQGHSIGFGGITVPCGSKDTYLDPSYNWTENGAWDLSVSEAASQNVCIDGVYYQLLCDGHIARVMNSAFLESSQGASYSGEVVIPATVDYEGITYSVTTIAPYAFYFCQSVTSVTLGSNMQSIGDDAFGWCSGLTKIICQGTTPPTMSNYDDVFFNVYNHITLQVPCGALEAYQSSAWNDYYIHMVESEVTEVDGLYYELPCSGTTATLIPHPSYATLEHVSIEDFEYGGVQYTVTAIADGAFDGCDSIENFDCHSNISSIGANAFRNCTGITYFGFYHADTPPTLGEGVFDGLGIDTLWLSVPFCSQYDYSVHPVFGQFGEIFGDGDCEYTFINAVGDKQWTNPDNWAEGEVPNGTARVGIFNDCEIDTDLTVGSVTIGSTYSVEYDLYERLTVKDGATLTATNFIYTTGEAENFVIEDGAQVIHPNAGAKATVEKGISGYVGEKDNYYLIGYSFAENSAVDDMDNLLENDYDLYYYDEPTHYWMNQKNAANNFTELEATKGYLYANSQAVTLGLKGTLNPANETVTVPLSYTDGIALAGFNLVGNPFVHNVTAFAGSNVADEVYRMNGDGSNVVVGEISETDPLKPAEGFFVKATDSDASITFNDNGGAKGGTKALEPVERPTITLNLTQNGLIIDRLIVKNDGEPLEKFTLNENSTRVYTTQDGQDYAVIVRGRDGVHTVSTEVNEIPINFKATKNGTYTLTVNVENTDLDYLHLIDNLTGADVDLLSPAGFPLCNPPSKGAGGLGQGDSTQPAYTFTAKTTDYASRFRLVFSICGDANDDNDAPFAFVSNGEIVLIGDDASQASLQIVDMTGRVIRCTDGVHTVSTSGMVPGVYVLRLINGNDVRTQKLIISE